VATRYHIKNLGGADEVSQYIGYAALQHGTTNNGCQFYVSCPQFGSANSPFLTARTTSGTVRSSRCTSSTICALTSAVNARRGR
jgi:hypothetical protein